MDKPVPPTRRAVAFAQVRQLRVHFDAKCATVTGDCIGPLNCHRLPNRQQGTRTSRHDTPSAPYDSVMAYTSRSPERKHRFFARFCYSLNVPYADTLCGSRDNHARPMQERRALQRTSTRHLQSMKTARAHRDFAALRKGVTQRRFAIGIVVARGVHSHWSALAGLAVAASHAFAATAAQAISTATIDASRNSHSGRLTRKAKPFSHCAVAQ